MVKYVATRLTKDNIREEEKEFEDLDKAIRWCTYDGMIDWADITDENGDLVWEKE